MALQNMGDQFRGLPMGDLIGGPLMAAADAQIRLANNTAQFIQTVGFTPKAGATADPLTGKVDQSQLDVRTVDFRFDRPAGPANDQGVVPTETVQLEVPLLAIIKVPSLFIDTVDIVFDMEVKNSESSKESEDMSAKMSADMEMNWGIFKVNVHVEGSVATHKENARSSDQSAKYHVEVHAADKGMPEGLARVLDMMNSAIAPKTITQNDPAKNAAPVAGKAPIAGSAPAAIPASQVTLDHEPTELEPGKTYVVREREHA